MEVGGKGMYSARDCRATPQTLILAGAVAPQSNGRRACERRQPMGRAGNSAANQRADGAGFERGGRDGSRRDSRSAAICLVSVSCLRVAAARGAGPALRPRVTGGDKQCLTASLTSSRRHLIKKKREIRLMKNRNKMASMLQNVKATMGWQRHLLLADFDENENPLPDKFKRKASFSSLNTICMSIRKQIPLKQVELNFHETPLWENMEARKKSQVLQSITKTARNAFGTVSQKIQKTGQNPVHSTVTFPAEDTGSSSATSFSKKRRTVQAPCPCMNTVTSAASSKCSPRSSRRSLLGPTRVSEHIELRGFPSWDGEDAVPLLRSRRASAALKSLYSSPPTASRRTEEFNHELELVSSGNRHLKHLFWGPDDDIVQKERQHVISN